MCSVFVAPQEGGSSAVHEASEAVQLYRGLRGAEEESQSGVRAPKADRAL